MKILQSNVTVLIKNMADSIAFYQSLGFTLVNRWGDHYAQLSAPGITIGLHPSKEENLHGNSGNLSIGLTTDNFEETKLELVNLSISFTERQEEGGGFLHFNDPDGNGLYFIKPRW